jgi:hypothetical protein
LDVILAFVSSANPDSRVVADRLPAGSSVVIDADSYPATHPSRTLVDGGGVHSWIADVNLERVTAVYWPLYVFPVLPRSPTPDLPGYERFLNRELLALLLGQLLSLPAPTWVNHPFFSHLADFKVRQLRQAAELGFRIPTTLVSTDAEELTRFFRRSTENGRPVVTKAIHKGYFADAAGQNPEMIFTQTVAPFEPEHIPRDSALLLQEKLPAEFELRVIVVASSVFCTKVSCNLPYDDIRVVPVQEWIGEPFALPPDIAEKCLQLTRLNGLMYSAIDLVAVGSDYFFLDLNASGHWQWWAEAGCHDVAGAIAKALAAT